MNWDRRRKRNPAYDFSIPIWRFPPHYLSWLHWIQEMNISFRSFSPFFVFPVSKIEIHDMLCCLKESLRERKEVKLVGWAKRKWPKFAGHSVLHFYGHFWMIKKISSMKLLFMFSFFSAQLDLWSIDGEWKLWRSFFHRLSREYDAMLQNKSEWNNIPMHFVYRYLDTMITGWLPTLITCVCST